MDIQKNHIENAIKAMIQIGVIKFRSLSKYHNVADFYVTSDIFTDKTFISSVYEDDWNNCPARAVAAELTSLIIDGKLEFIPLKE